MERSFLEGFGLEKEQVDAILNRASEDIGKKVNEFEHKLAEEREKTSAVQSELDITNNTLNGLKKSNKDNESLQKQIDDLSAQIKLEREKNAQDILERSMDFELKMAGCIDPKCVHPLIDMNKVEMTKDGTIVGLEEQIKSLSSDGIHNALFGTPTAPQETPQPEVVRGGYNPMRGETIETEAQPSGNSIGQMLGMERAQAGSANDTSDAFWKSITP